MASGRTFLTPVIADEALSERAREQTIAISQYIPTALIVMTHENTAADNAVGSDMQLSIRTTLAFLAVTSMIMSGCATSHSRNCAGVNAASMLYGDSLTAEARAEIERAFALRTDADRERWVVSITANHSGMWTMRDRQLLADGSVVVTDYEIWPNVDEPQALKTNEYVVRNAEDRISLIADMVKSFVRHEDAAAYTTGTSSKVHATIEGAFFGEAWMRPFDLTGVFESSESSTLQGAPLPSSVILEAGIRLLDQKLLAECMVEDPDQESPFAKQP